MRRTIAAIAIVGTLLLAVNVLFINFGRKSYLLEEEVSRSELRQRFDELLSKYKLQEEQEERLREQITLLEKNITNSIKQRTAHSKSAEDRRQDIVFPIILFSCNRPSVSKALDDLIKYRPSKEKFPIIVSQDCGHEETSNVIQQYKEHIHAHIKQPDLGEVPDLTPKEKKLEGYYKVSRHYRWGLGQIFDVLNYEVVIILEDDLNISEDFFSYFEALYPVLASDKSLYCVSAWNDNGKPGLVKDDPELVYRSDFFPGLGWMMLKSLWEELKDKWPKGFWDDWLRQEAQRVNRACIRPEISRTHTFGEKGVSLGLFYKQHLQHIILNQKPVDWKAKDLSYLHKDRYDNQFVEQVYKAPMMSLSQLTAGATGPPVVRILYSNKDSFKLIAKTLQIMDDFKDGVPRTAYRGIVPIMYNNIRVYIAPPPEWTNYDKTWT